MTKAERNQAIITDYLNGLTRLECSVKYGMSDVGRVLKESGIKFGRKGGKRPKCNEVDRIWVDKQIVALTKQGFTNDYICNRYGVGCNRLAKARREAGLTLRNKEPKWQLNLSSIDGFRIPEIELGITARPKRTQRIAI